MSISGIGFWFPSENNGLNTTAVNAHIESDDMNARLETILAHASDVNHNRNEQFWRWMNFQISQSLLTKNKDDNGVN